MERIVRLNVVRPYVLYVEFSDGTCGEWDMTQRLQGPMFEPLRDPAFFAQVHLDEFGVPVWPNGADIAPDALHERLQSPSVSKA